MEPRYQRKYIMEEEMLHSVKFGRHDKFSNNGKVTIDGVVGVKENLEYVGV